MKRAALLTVMTGVAVGALAVPPAAFAGGKGPTSGTVASAAPTLSSITLSATDVLGGTPVTGTATLASSAPPGGMAVALSSDNPAAATVPAMVTVPSGSRSASFPVTTFTVPNPQSALIIGTAGGVTAYGIVTVRTPSTFTTGSISVLSAGSGGGTVTSQPAGIRCTYDAGTSTGACTATFPVGTVVRLSAQAATGSKFQGWRGTPGCSDPSRITVARGTNITCQPGFAVK
jgi:hypothetical protein